MSEPKGIQNKSQSHLPAWQIHENHIASLYRRLGFTVIQNINVDGQQVDLICEKWIPGIGHTRLCIDCKHTELEENRSVSKDDVDMFIFTFRNRADSNGWTAGVMVSNRPFTQYAKAAAAKHLNIHLKTIEELHEEILHIRSYLYESVRRYEEVKRFSDYIAPYATISSTVGPHEDNQALLERIIQNWLHDTSNPQLCLFGDFGTGKTTFLEYLHNILAQQYLSDASVRIPLLVPLRKYYEVADHEEMILQFFSQECQANIPYSLFHEFLTRGKLLLLLDGFDEMGARSDPTTRKANYLKLAPLVEGHSKVLISCRPAYFFSLEETHSVFSFVSKQIGFAPPLRQGPISEHLYSLVQDSDLKAVFSKTRSVLSGTKYIDLSLFDKKQIKAYLKKHDGDIRSVSNGELDARSLFDRIRKIYDLEDLAKRPILLKLIVDTLPQFKKATDETYEIHIGDKIQKVPDITPSVLYAVYTEKELEREYRKGKVRWLIDRQDKVKVIAAIALEMFKNDVPVLDRIALSQVVQRGFPGNEEEQAHYLTDIRTCSFLSRDSQESIRFTHKSFMEYYAAVALRMAMSGPTAIQELLSGKALTDEVAFFLGDGVAAAPNSFELKTSLIDLYGKLSKVSAPSGTCVQNLLNILNYAQDPIPMIKNVDADLLVYKKLKLEQQIAENIKVDVVRTVKLHVSKWVLTDSEIKRWESNSSRIQELSGRRLDLRSIRVWGTIIEKFVACESYLHYETWRDSRVRNGGFQDSILLNSSGSVGPEWLPEEATFENCILVGLNMGGPLLQNSSFVNCTFVMCRSNDGPPKKLAMQGCRGFLIKEGSASVREWAQGITFAGLEAATVMRDKPTGKSPTWDQVLLHCFDPEIQKLPKSTNEIKARLRQVDIATKLIPRVGDAIFVSAGAIATNDECRIIHCNPHSITFFNLRTKMRFDQPIRKVTLQEGNRINVAVEA